MLNENDQKMVLKLAESLTGCSLNGDTRRDSIVSNVERRMRDLGFDSLGEYIKLVDHDPTEKNYLISNLTIHTTSWFRENPHFVIFQEILLDSLERKEPFTVWCAAASTGEEVYSFALVLEEFRRVHPGFEYRVYGSDIDPVSIETAERAVYKDRNINFNLSRYKEHLLYGSGKTESLFTLSKDIRSRVSFHVHDLRSNIVQKNGPFDVVICRNVLIYFSNDGVNQVVKNLLGNLKSGGHMILGHSETISASEFSMTQRGHSVFVNQVKTGTPIRTRLAGGPNSGPITIANGTAPKPSVLVIDDAATARKTIKKVLDAYGFETHTVSSAEEASRFIKTVPVDAITLDLQMPGEGGEAWLTKERAGGLKVPVLIVSEIRRDNAAHLVTVLGGLAQDFFDKSTVMQRTSHLRDTLIGLIGTYGSRQVRLVTGSGTKGTKEKSQVFPKRSPSARPDLIAIGASTGGPQAIAKLLANMSPDCPPIVVTQHISPNFALAFAERIAHVSNLGLGTIEDGAKLKSGHVYVADGDYHMGVRNGMSGLELIVSAESPINRHRPSVDFLFRSLVNVNVRVMAALLTGMGRDGAAGLKSLKGAGAFCIAQEESDCIVYGMPREAIALNAVDFVGNLDEIRRLIDEALRITSSTRAS